ncbi:MAG: arylsulfotransferase family protein [Candidatus Dormiibacterota bacterium]
MVKLGGWPRQGWPMLVLLCGCFLIGCAAAPGPGRATEAVLAASSGTQSVSCSGVSLYPTPGSQTASTATQISFQGIASAKLSLGDISVVGSVSGSHRGRLVADSSGRGDGFYPDQPFVPDELVTVTSHLDICGASDGTATFRVAREAPPLPPPTPGTGLSPSPPTQSFLSEPSLKPPVLVVSKPAPASSEGDIFISPDPESGGQAGQAGPMIVNGKGQLVWFDPVPQGELAADFREQTYAGQPVLTWFEGDYVDGHGTGDFVIMNDRYQIVRTVEAAEGYAADLHEFVLGAGQTAWITIYNTVGWNLTAAGGPSDGAVYDSIVQELDLRTGNVLFEWHSLDHVGLANSFIPYVKSQTTPWDYFHVNSVDPTDRGTVLISGRDTEAAYLVDEATGRVIWTLGGKSNTFVMGEGAQFALQHDVELHGTSTVTLFDDEDTGADGPPARAVELRLNLRLRTAALVWARQLPGFLLVLNQGNVQLLPDGDVMVGWGAGTYTTEFSKKGKLLFDAHFPGLTSSYRAYRDPWTAEPTTRPAVATEDGSGDELEVFASWNGSTGVTGWRVVGGSSPTALATVGSAARQGFQTKISLSQKPAYLRVEALGKAGQILASSEVVSTS